MWPPEHRRPAPPRWCGSTCSGRRCCRARPCCATRRCARTPPGSTRGGPRRGCWSSTPPGVSRSPGPGVGPRARGRWTPTAPPVSSRVPTTGDVPPDDAVLLGEADGVAYWAVRDAGELVPGEDPVDRADLRTAGAALDALGAGLLTTAVAVLNWHDAAQFCGRDGSPTHPEAAGWHRVCEAHGHEDYPRTDPAVICLVHDGADRVLLARQPVWPEGRFSVLAGFVEAGESLEACVLREIHEEVGVPVRDIAYLGSQAWPFPRSLMVGFQAVADADAPLRPADGEIAEAMWVTRAELRAGPGGRRLGGRRAIAAAAPGRGVDRPRDAGGLGRDRLTARTKEAGPAHRSRPVYRPVSCVRAQPGRRRRGLRTVGSHQDCRTCGRALVHRTALDRGRQSEPGRARAAARRAVWNRRTCTARRDRCAGRAATRLTERRAPPGAQAAFSSPVRRGAYVERERAPDDGAARHALLLQAALAELGAGRRGQPRLRGGAARSSDLGHPARPGARHVRPALGRPARRPGARRTPRPCTATTSSWSTGWPRRRSARTVVDVARRMSFEAAVAVADAALRSAGRSEADIAACRAQLEAATRRAKGWPGVPAARQVLAFADGRSESVGESRSRVAIARAGLPTPALQLPGAPRRRHRRTATSAGRR